MILRQEEETPLGNYFHDSGMLRLFNLIENSVDEFIVDTERTKALCDELSVKAREFKNFIAAVEKEELKKAVKKEVQEFSSRN